MPIEVLMPALSPTMTEGNLARWLKKEGDTVNAGDIIAEIETDKATMEVEAVDEGVLGKIVVNDGTENVSVNSVIALILEDGEDKKVLASYKLPEKVEVKVEEAPAQAEEKAAPVVAAPAAPASQRLAPITPNLQSQTIAVQKTDRKVNISPVAKRLAQENNIDVSLISGSGPDGRIVKSDVVEFSKSGGGTNVVRRDPQEFSLQKNNNVRKVIAQRLLSSKQNIPHFYLSCDVRIDKLLELRKEINDNALLIDGKPVYKVSVNDLVIKAVGLALKKVPAANSSWSDEAILVYNNVDVSVAVAIDDGLITPIVRNADQKTITDISAEMKGLIKKAKDGKLQPEEFQGGGFSISNLGMYGIDSFNAIVNPPQSCILSVGAGVQKPIVKNGNIEVGTVMNVSLSCDHRCVDGAVGAEFLQAFKDAIQNPIKMLL